MKNLILVTALAAALAGCALPPPAAPLERPSFPQAEYDVLPRSGSATVTGQAFLKTRGGDVKTAAGNMVYLNPVTSYSRWAYEHQGAPGGLGPVSELLHKYMQSTTADGSGRFTFRNVAPGRYYLTANVSWESPMGSVMVRQGGIIWKEVTVVEGGANEFIVTR